MDHLHDPSAAITYLTEHCPNLGQLSLRRYFSLAGSNNNFLHLECSLQSRELRELDLYGNYFNVLPKLPDNITNIRLSCSGTENVQDLTSRLQALSNLKDIRIVLSSREISDTAVESAGEFLEIFLPLFGSRITSLQLMVYQIRDKTLNMILDYCTRLTTLSLNVVHITGPKLIEIFQDPDRASVLKSIKFYRLQLPYKVLFAIAKYCVNLEEIEFSFMSCVDDRFLKTLANNCSRLRVVNFNGCEWVTDKGLCALARGCPLKEIRVRATSVTDKCVYVLAQCCPNLEWVAHADYTGKPKFSEDALQKLKDSCIQRVIC